MRVDDRRDIVAESEGRLVLDALCCDLLVRRGSVRGDQRGRDTNRATVGPAREWLTGNRSQESIWAVRSSSLLSARAHPP